MLKGRAVTGVAAGRFHTVLWTREAVYTVGINGGQLGKSQHLSLETKTSEDCPVFRFIKLSSLGLRFKTLL